MLKLLLQEFPKVFNEKILVFFQFFIIMLHFMKFEFFPEIEIEIERLNFILSIMGCLIIIMASIVMVTAIKDLGNNLSPFPSPIANGKLITSGIYSFIRHPMYYSLILISFGVFLIKLSLYYLCLTMSLGLVIKFKIILEEQYLNKKFKKYFLYKSNVKY